MEVKKFFHLFGRFIAIAALVSACGRATATATPQTLMQSTPISSPTPNLLSIPTPALTTVINPFTGVTFQIDPDGCVVIPNGGTAYGAWTVAGNPNQVHDIGQAEVKNAQGDPIGIYKDPLELPRLAYPNYKLCP